MRGIISLLVPVVALLGPAPGPGQQADTTADTVPPSPRFRLEPIEATVARGSLPAERVPMAITVVNTADLPPGRPEVDLEELLRQVPGVVVGNRHSLANDTRVVVRGFGARSAFGVRGVRILLDGIPLTLPDGQGTLTNVDPGSIGRVEVLRGPGAALYGNAAGGVIALTTVEPSERELSARVAVGSYDAADPLGLVRLQANAGGIRDRDSWFLALSHMSTEGFRHYSRARRSGLNARYRRSLGQGTTVTGLLHVAAVPLAENPGSLPLDSARQRPRMAWPQNVATGSSKEVAQAQGGVSVTHRVGRSLLEAAAYGVGRDMDNPLPFGRYIQLQRRGGGVRVMGRTADPGATSWTAGIEAQAQRDDRLERDNVAGVISGPVYQDRVDRVTSLAPFAFGQVMPLPWLALRAGARYDAVAFHSRDRLGATASDRAGRRTLDAWSGSSGIMVEPRGGWRAWTSLSTWFQTPTTTELINAPPPPGEPCCQTGFNPELEPQDGWGWEAGVAGRRGHVHWEVVGYDLKVRNEILPFQIAGIEGRDFYRNAGGATHRGVELSGELGGQVRPGTAWSLSMAYTYSDFRFSQPEDPSLRSNRLPGVPPHRLTSRATWRQAGTRVELEIEWVDRTPADDQNSAHAPAYTLADMRAARQVASRWAMVEPFVGVTNILDTRYSASLVINAFGGRFYEPGPGRALLLGLRAMPR